MGEVGERQRTVVRVSQEPAVRGGEKTDSKATADCAGLSVDDEEGRLEPFPM
jgi:hypothetical protein